MLVVVVEGPALLGLVDGGFLQLVNHGVHALHLAQDLLGHVEVVGGQLGVGLALVLADLLGGDGVVNQLLHLGGVHGLHLAFQRGRLLLLGGQLVAEAGVLVGLGFHGGHQGLVGLDVLFLLVEQACDFCSVHVAWFDDV